MGWSTNGALSFPPGFAWGRPPPPTRSRARPTRTAAGCPSGTPSATRLARSTATTRATSPATTTTATARTSASSPRSASTPTASRSPGRGSSRAAAAPVNQKGLDFYDRLRRRAARSAASRRPRPCTTGTCRRTPGRGRLGRPRHRARFADYAAIVAEALGDRVDALDHPERAPGRGQPRLPARRARPRPAGRRRGGRPPPTTSAGHGLATRVLRDLLPAGQPVGSAWTSIPSGSCGAR